MTNAMPARNQMQLSLPAAANSRRREQPVSAPRARWWFEKMRQVVTQASEWQPEENGGPTLAQR